MGDFIIRFSYVFNLKAKGRFADIEISKNILIAMFLSLPSI
jgi:hypothetical protein